MTTASDVSTRRRVKLYMLNDERQWDDKGTGHVSATFVEQNIMALVVISETDGSHLLESKIQHDTAYQKQQETLIVWSEGDNMDLALSFQEKTGCDDIWEKICNVQGKDPSVEITQDLIDDADDIEDLEMEASSGSINQGFEFPPCDMGHLAEISEMFTQVMNYPIQRERMAAALERIQYIKQLIDVFHKAEDLEDTKALHYLYEIIRALIQFNRRNLYEIIFSEEYIMDVVGMLEYMPMKRVKHREFLSKKANFREVLPMNTTLKHKIHQTFRVQYIQDNCLPPPSLFDDNSGSILNSFVYLNKIDIITRLQDDHQFMSHLFTGLISSEISVDHRRDLLLLLKDFCVTVNSFQPTQKDSFFATLNVSRALKSIFVSFKISDDSIKMICIDILQIFVENQTSVVRAFFMSDFRENVCDNESLSVNVLVNQLTKYVDPEMSNGFIILGILKVLLDPENMVCSVQKNEKTEFLDFFYKHSMDVLLRPLANLVTEKDEDYHGAMVIHNILELLAFCVEFHSTHMKNYLCHHHTILDNVVSVFKSRHKILVLAAVHVIRKFLGSRDEVNYRYIIKHNVLRDVVTLLDNNQQYNMLNSTILEMFEFIRTENVACIIANVMETSWAVLEHHKYTNIFRLLRTRYEQSVERSLKNENIACLMNVTLPRRVRRGNITLEEDMNDDDDQWYDQDENEEEHDKPSPVNITSTSESSIFMERSPRKSSASKDSDTFKSSGRYLRDQHIPINIRTTTLTLGALATTDVSNEPSCFGQDPIIDPSKIPDKSIFVNAFVEISPEEDADISKEVVSTIDPDIRPCPDWVSLGTISPKRLKID